MNENGNPLLGVIHVALGRADGFKRFGATASSFLNSLAPLIAFPLAGAIIELFRVGWLAALALVFLTLVAQLAPPVLSHALAKRWGREAQWLHYATSYNWCYWAVPVAGALLTVLLGVAVGLGFPSGLAAQAVLLGLLIYSLWLNWFVARSTLQLSRTRAGLLVVIVNAATAALAVGPALLG